MKTFISILTFFSVNAIAAPGAYECLYVQNKAEECKYYPDVKNSFELTASSTAEAKAACKLHTGGKPICSVAPISKSLTYTPGDYSVVTNKYFLTNILFKEKSAAHRTLLFRLEDKGIYAYPMNLTGYSWNPFNFLSKYRVEVNLDKSMVRFNLSAGTCSYFIQNENELIAQKNNPSTCPEDLARRDYFGEYGTDIFGTWKSKSCSTCTVKLSDTTLPYKNGRAQFIADFIHWESQGQVLATNVGVQSKHGEIYLFSPRNGSAYCYYFRNSETSLIYIHSLSSGKCAQSLTLQGTARKAIPEPKPQPKPNKKQNPYQPTTPTTKQEDCEKPGSQPQNDPYATWLQPTPEVVISYLSDLEVQKIKDALIGNWKIINISESYTFESSLLGITIDGPSWIRGSDISVDARDGTVVIGIGGHNCRYTLKNNILNAQKDNSASCPGSFQKR